MVNGEKRLAVKDPSAHRIIPNYFEIEANINFGAFNGWFSRHTGYLTVLSIAALILIVGFYGPTRNSGGAGCGSRRPSGSCGAGPAGTSMTGRFLGYVRTS